MKKNEDGFSIVEILIVILVLSLVGTIGWIAFNRLGGNVKQTDQTNSSQANKSTRTNSTAALQPEDVTAKIKSSYESKYKLLDIDENNQPKQGEMSIRLSKSAPPQKAEGYNFYTDYDGGSSIFLMVGPVNWDSDTLPRKADTTIRTEVADILKDFGLTKTGTNGKTDDGTATDVYRGRGLICVIEAPASRTSSTGLSCGRIDAYKETAAKTQPIASAMPNVEQSTVLMNLKITDSKVSGYQKAQISQGSIDSGGGSTALLYKKNNDPWVYFRNTQQDILCSEYNTTDLRNAFKGDVCYGANDVFSTVQ
ncbi:prepilin-type N-terminal cleavage/methylation domain-containing protein [Candidatus Saccharibacteria bacterium]|nr:MAG: prepilin-type N-terminal cleavage/methylation domain-containing protein [Candidatus Saccharibacteria bacterium]